VLHNPGVTEKLAKFVVDTRWDDLPPQVAHQAKRSLMNFFAVALTGCRDRTSRSRCIARRILRRQAGDLDRPARAHRRAESAAFLNAAGANVLDFCDTHVPTAIHPTAPVAPALLALAELQAGERPRSAARLRARPGSRVPHRARDVAEPLQQRLAHHLDLRRVRRRRRQRQAVGVSSPANGVGARHCGDASRPACANVSARRQKASASAMPRATGCGRRCWRKNFAGPPEPLPACRAITTRWARRRSLSALTDGLGESWEIMATSYKPYPCGFVMHPVLDCVLDWRRENPGRSSRRSW
jgi:2-methylcitrate dehydratase PrpD